MGLLYTDQNSFVKTHVLPLLLKHEPKIAQYEDHCGDLLLHIAIESENSVDTIELILDAYPEGISKKGGYGLLPFHSACNCSESESESDSIQILELLLSRYPSAASISPEKWRGSRRGSFPLHRCFQLFNANLSDEFIMSLIEAYPDAASIKTRDNETALHFACWGGFPLAIIQRLYGLYPEAVTVQANYSALPFHRACLSASMEVITFLLEKYPASIQSKDRVGQLPLHIAIRRQAPLEVIQILIEPYPNAVNIADNDGELPLHVACRHDASLEVIQLLIDRFVGDERHHRGLGIADNRGELPIHLYAHLSEDTRLETLQYLLEIYPGSIHVVNNEGRLPLYHACNSGRFVDLEIIRVLVEAAPYTVIQESARERTPLQHLWDDENVEVIEYILERQNEVVLAMKEAFEDVADTQLGLPDLVIANIWSFAKPDLSTRP